MQERSEDEARVLVGEKKGEKMCVSDIQRNVCGSERSDGRTHELSVCVCVCVRECVCVAQRM